MKVVINACFGGFSLSPEATLEVYKRGGPIEATPVEDWFTTSTGKREIEEWRDYLASPPRVRARSSFITVFSPDEKFVLCSRPGERSHAVLVQVVEEMGEAANGSCADLKVVEVPDGVDWEISEYDGNEHVAEKHRVWG
jgi:hypothetical protein